MNQMLYGRRHTFRIDGDTSATIEFLQFFIIYFTLCNENENKR